DPDRVDAGRMPRPFEYDGPDAAPARALTPRVAASCVSGVHRQASPATGARFINEAAPAAAPTVRITPPTTAQRATLIRLITNCPPITPSRCHSSLEVSRWNCRGF